MSHEATVIAYFARNVRSGDGVRIQNWLLRQARAIDADPRGCTSPVVAFREAFHNVTGWDIDDAAEQLVELAS